MEGTASVERWRQVQRLFAEVVGLDATRREARLERVGRDDPRLREEVRALLDRHERGEDVGHLYDPALPPTVEGKLPVEGPAAEVIAGRYRVIAELGRGAMGVVYKVFDTRLDRHVALKFLARNLGANQKAHARLTAEAKAVSALDHPHICTLYEIGETADGHLFLAMAYYEGETLSRLIARGPLPVADAVRIALHIVRGLGAAHRRGIVHRDIKPANILVTDEGVTKILDFGIAKVSGVVLTRTGDTLGTPAYMSPEQLRGEVDARTDLWALGVGLYEMLAGERPFRGDYEAALLYAILNEEPVPLTQRREDVPQELAEVVRRCLEKDPAARYQSADELEADLAGLDQAESPSQGTQPPRRRRGIPRRLRWAISGLGVVILGLASLVPQVRTALTTGFGGPAAPAVRQLAVVPFSVEGADAAVGEGLTIALTDLLTQLGPYAETPFTVVPAREMREITSAQQARQQLGVEEVITGRWSLDHVGGAERLRKHIRIGLEYSDLNASRRWNLSVPEDRMAMLHLQTVGTWVEHFGVELPTETYAALAAGGTTSASAYGHYLRGIAALHRSGRPEGVEVAIGFFHDALQADSLYALVHVGLGEAYVRKYNATNEGTWIELAESHCARALELAEGLASAHATLGSLYASTGDHAAALREYERAATLGSADAEVYASLGRLYVRLGQRTQAEASFRKAIGLQPGTWERYEGLSDSYSDWGHYSEAIEVIEQFMAFAPKDLEGAKRLARAYEELAFHTEDDERRESALRRAAEVYPTRGTYSNLANEYSNQGRYAQEVEALERALELDSTDHESWGSLARAYERAGASSERVQTTYERAVSVAESKLVEQPASTRTLLALADYAVGLGQNPKAQRRLREALEVGGYAIVEQAATLYERMGMRAQALELISRALADGSLPVEFESNEDLADLREDPRYLQIRGSAQGLTRGAPD